MEKEGNKKQEIDWNTKENKQLLIAFLILRNKDEAGRFLRDLMTKGEIEEFAKRLEAARLLSRDVQYLAIIEETGLSSTTIARIAKWLKGPLCGYKTIIDRLQKHHIHSHNSIGKGLFLH